ncbi:MAG TPA: twin-arginine translocation signal domain-containing protein, partial [Burkholderiales bacterium]|nr:twin-arginine translocation signal domain-containing protein [Burkholderiales bacterium]
MARTINRREFLVGGSVLAGGVATSLALQHPAARAETQQDELTDLTAVTAVTAMRNGDIKAEDYARALIDRAQSLQDLNAFLTLNREMVLEAAR